MTMKEFVTKYLRIDPINGAALLPDARIGNHIYSVTFSAGTYANPKLALCDIDTEECIWTGDAETCPYEIDRIEAIRTRWSSR